MICTLQQHIMSQKFGKKSNLNVCFMGGCTITSKTKTNECFLKKKFSLRWLLRGRSAQKKFKKAYLAFEANSALSQIYKLSAF